MQSRSPSWGAWIETSLVWREIFIKNIVAPPRGERGLKRLWDKLLRLNNLVAPPRGERGLKQAMRIKCQTICTSLPLVGSVD